MFHFPYRSRIDSKVLILKVSPARIQSYQQLFACNHSKLLFNTIALINDFDISLI